MNDLRNEFLFDARYCYRRVAKLLSNDLSRDALYDSALYLAFGIEKTCQAIVWNVNPLFVLESLTLDAAVNSFYREHLPKLVKPTAQEAKYASLKDLLIRAQSVSPTAVSNFGVIMKVANLRNTIAHRRSSEIDTDQASRLVRRMFYPLVTGFGAEIDLNPEVCFADRGHEMQQIQRKAEREEKLDETIQALLVTHEKVWEAHRSDLNYLKNAEVQTRSLLKDARRTDYSHMEHECPACLQPAVLRIESDWDVEGGHAWMTGIYASSLTCFYCGLELDGEGIDYFKYNQQLPLWMD